MAYIKLDDFDTDKVDEWRSSPSGREEESAFAVFLMEDGKLIATNDEVPPEGCRVFLGLMSEITTPPAGSVVVEIE